MDLTRLLNSVLRPDESVPPLIHLFWLSWTSESLARSVLGSRSQRGARGRVKGLSLNAARLGRGGKLRSLYCRGGPPMGTCIRQDRGLMLIGLAADQGQWENKFVSKTPPAVSPSVSLSPRNPLHSVRQLWPLLNYSTHPGGVPFSRPSLTSASVCFDQALCSLYW